MVKENKIKTNRKYESGWRKFLTFSILALTAGACQEEFGKETTNINSLPTGIINLSFEVETLTIPTLQNEGNASSQEKIQAIPFSERNKVQVSAYEDGTTNWRLEKLTPKNDLSVQHETPPNNQQQVKVTMIDQTGMGSFYDSKGVLLYTHEVPVPSFIDVVANIKENPNMIFTAMGVKTVENVKLILANAEANGHIIQDLGNGMVSVRTENGIGNSSAQLRGEADNFTTVDIFNTSLGIMIGSTMYDELENIVCQAFYRYGFNIYDQLVPEAIYMQSWDKDPITGEIKKVETNTYFENVTATININ